MRILFITPSLYPNGPVRVLLSIAPELRKNGHEVKFWYFDELDGAEKEQSTRIDFFKKPDTSGFDIVHSVGIRPDAYVRFQHKNIAAPTVTTMMNYVTEDLKFQYNWVVSKVFTPLWKIAISKHTLVVAQQAHMKHYYEALWGLKNVEVIPLCSLFKKGEVDAEIAKRITDFVADSPSIVSVGLVTERKGLGQIIKLLELPQHKNLKWVHIGAGKEFEELKERIAASSAVNNCLLLGQVPNSAAYLPLFSVFVMPSYSEGFGLALLEAVIQKVPAVTTDIKVFQIIFNEKEVPKFTPDSIDHFSSLLLKTLKNPEVQIEAANKRYLADYTIQSVTQKYIALYSKLIKL